MMALAAGIQIALPVSGPQSFGRVPRARYPGLVLSFTPPQGSSATAHSLDRESMPSTLFLPECSLVGRHSFASSQCRVALQHFAHKREIIGPGIDESLGGNDLLRIQ